ncbi:probable disease resistance protein At5g63020 isoform X2 [Prosopis cineraria]|uniref:probable disease resistance protein At5g63020 isoform X2 n=1 Tax=Prosopis cineraria TaxID=364024 RepID=UPI00240F3CF2|nr:probable disease resistance protein At5g63020 isoform X2 [Prosopis cineraria]
MDPSSIIWDVTKCLCGCLKNQACYVYDLEENLQSLEETSEKLENMKKDVEELVEEEEHTGEMRRSHQVTAWLQKIDGIQEIDFSMVDNWDELGFHNYACVCDYVIFISLQVIMKI